VAKIRARGLVKRFGAVTVLDGIDLDVADGELVALLGPSGCGKSTLIRLIAGLDAPDAGELWFDDERVFGDGVSVPPERRRLGMVFQSYAVWPHKTVLENVAYPLRVRGASNDEQLRRAREALGWVRLEGLEDRHPHQLSGGQQQRVAIARAMVGAPRVLLLDEPLSNLDTRLREELRRELSELRARLGVTVVLVTHDQSEALAMADRVAVMERGHIAQLDAPEAIYARPRSLYVGETVGTMSALAPRAWRVVEGDASRLHVEVPGGALVVERPEAWAPESPLDAWAVVVRPEAVHVERGSDRTEPGALRCTLGRSAFLGERRELRLDLPGGAALRTFAAPEVSVSSPGSPCVARVARAVLVSRASPR
jgi:ABC-type Fe3+/spermidine/putrescine transport system ATPase subunit